MYKPIRGIPGAPECVCCFERNCFGCSLTAQAIGLCPVCGKDIFLGDFYDWRGNELVHWDCLDQSEEEWEKDE